MRVSNTDIIFSIASHVLKVAMVFTVLVRIINIDDEKFIPIQSHIWYNGFRCQVFLLYYFCDERSSLIFKETKTI